MSFTHLARNLRKNQTDAEQILWLQLRDRRFLNLKFRRQFPVESYIVDFICLDCKIIIELDGSQHHEQGNEDAIRTKFLNQRGFKVIRFWNNDVFNNLDGVLESLRLVVEKQKKW
ncbi:MAG: endonuclease domain-containing protein [Methylococcales symbiont of Iophon sp. n. MRB-2018]|nr:MAG: endonuclease domain-containing protein [Methylococcales symbiont of Iophon sp. n. MRB-2018]KAF3980353.1 MAG: endonuclease domain-containing protein [Methylococcales symbiont of Iophon sp. n. MRB-2018]